MKLKEFHLIAPNDWLFQDHPDVIEAKKRAIENPKADEKIIEEYVRQWVLKELIETYGYPKEWLGERIVIEEKVKMGSTYKEADISIKNANRRTYLYIETKNASAKGQVFDEAKSQLETYLASTHTATIGMVTNGYDTKVLEKKIDPNDFNFIPDIPGYDKKNVSYKSVLVRNLSGAEPSKGRKTGLSPITDKLESILFDCHSTIRDIDGLHDDEALDELSKIIFTKIYDEREVCRQEEGAAFKFQIYGAGNTEEVASIIRGLYDDARSYDISSNAQKVIGYERSRGVFKNQIRLSSNALVKIVEKLQQHSFVDSATDVKGRAFQKVLGAAIRAGMGQFFTPDEVVRLVIEMIQPEPNDLILDPFCGSGHFLSRCIDYVEHRYANSLDDYSKYDFRFNRLHGIEKSDRMVRIAMTDMMLHDDGHTNIRNTDAFLSFDNYPDIVALGGNENDTPSVFSKILTNPPFGSIMQGEIGEIIGRFKMGAKKKALPLEYIAIERCLSFLRPGGRMAIVLPDGIVTNTNAQFARSWVMSQAKVIAVVSLPLETFAPFGTQTKTSIIFLEKPKEDEVINFEYPVFMGNIDDIGYDATGRTSGAKDVGELLQAWKKFSEEPTSDLACDKSRAYITKGENIQFRWDFKSGAVDTSDDYVPIGTYLNVVKQTKNLQKYEQDVFPYLSISELPNNPFLAKSADILNSPGGKLQGPKHIARGGDVLFARLGPSMGNKKSLLLHPEVGEIYCSNEFHVLRAKEGIPPEYILYLIKSDIFVVQAKSKARGATPSRLRLHEKDLPKLKVPKHTKDEMEKLGGNYLRGRIEAADLIAKAESLMSDVSPDF